MKFLINYQNIDRSIFLCHKSCRRYLVYIYIIYLKLITFRDFLKFFYCLAKDFTFFVIISNITKWFIRERNYLKEMKQSDGEKKSSIPVFYVSSRILILFGKCYMSIERERVYTKHKWSLLNSATNSLLRPSNPMHHPKSVTHKMGVLKMQIQTVGMANPFSRARLHAFRQGTKRMFNCLFMFSSTF